jgi:chromosome segregation ATPase
MELNIDALIERVQSTHAKYLEEKERFKTELNAANTDKENISRELEEANTKIQALDIAIANNQSELEAAKAEVTSANTEIESLTVDLQTARDELEAAKKEVSEKASLLETMTSKEEVDKILVNDANVYKELQNKYDTLKAKHASEVDELNKKVEELTKNAENFEIYSNSLKDEVKESSTALASLQNKYTDLENQKKDLDTAFAELKAKHNTAIETDAEKSAETDSKIAKLTEEINKKTTEASENLTKYNSLKDQTLLTIRHLVEEVIEPMEAELNKAKSENQELITKVNALTAKVDSLTKDNTTKDSRIVDLTQQISKLNASLKEDEIPVRKTNAHLQNYIDSMIPVPEGTAAAQVDDKPIRNTIKSEDTMVTPLGKVSKEIISSAFKLIDSLFKDVSPNNAGQYPLNHALNAAEALGINVTACNTIMDRLCAMSKDGKPVVYFNGATYLATMDAASLKDYIMRG